MKLTEGCGEKQISHAQKIMSDCASKLSAKLDVEDDLEAQLVVVVERALEESEGLAEGAMKQLDQLGSSEREARANVSARPRLSYETFSGDISQYPTFQANQRELFKMFEDKTAKDGGAAQQLYQLSKILSPDLASTVRSFSGAERGAEKAVEWLELRFNEPQLMIPRIFEEIRNIIPARSVSEVPRTAERVLTKVESLSALMKNDEASLPADIVQAIFRCLHLSTEEKKQVLHYLKANVKVSITEI